MAEHIKVPNVGTRIGYAVAIGTPSVVIPYTFFSTHDIVVTSNGVLLTEGVHYVVQPTGGFDKGFPGGLVVFLQPPIIPTIVVVDRQVPIERLVDFPPAGPLQTASLNTELDKGIAIDQQLKTDIQALDVRIDVLELGDPRLGRALLFPPEDLGLNHTLPDVPHRADQTLGFRSDGEIQMRSALLVPDSVRDVFLPNATQRANKVLGWDATGNFFDMVSVVGGTLAPDADNITYQANPSTVVRSVASVLRERLSIKDFGTHVGEGLQANDDAALAAAITYLNTVSGAAPTLFYPNGVYFHGPCPVRLTRTSACIEGEGTNTAFIVFTGPGTWLTIGNETGGAPRTENVSIRKLGLQLNSATGTFVRVSNTFNTRFESLFIGSADTFLGLGMVSVPTSQAFHTYVENCGGTSRVTGGALFRMEYGGGFYVSDCNFAVESTVGLSGAKHAFYFEFTNFVVVRVGRCFFANYDNGVNVIAQAGAGATDFIFNDVTFTNIAHQGMQLIAAAGGSIVGMRMFGCQINTLGGTCVYLPSGAGYSDSHAFVNCGFLGSGGAAFASNVAATNIVIVGNRIFNANSAGFANAAIFIFGGTGFLIEANVGNGPDSTTRAEWGLIMGAGADHYIVTGNRLGGTVGTIKQEPDGIASRLRRITNNGFANAAFNGYAIIVPVGPDAGGTYVNTTPYVMDVIVGGGLADFVSFTSINGVECHGATTGSFRLEPGDSINVQSPSASLTARIFE